jgi:hypothetical protein
VSGSSNSCARTLIFGSFYFIAFLSKFLSFFLFNRHFSFLLVFDCLFSFFRFGFLSPFVFSPFFALVLPLFFSSCCFISSLPQLATKRLGCCCCRLVNGEYALVYLLLCAPYSQMGNHLSSGSIYW